MTSRASSRGPHGRARLISVVVAGVVVVVLGATGLATQALELVFGPRIQSEREVERLRAEFDGQIPNGLESQRQALRDGEIEPKELRALADNASNCSLMSGSRPISVDLDSGGLSWSVAFGRDVENVDQLMLITDRCWEEHVGAAEIQYSRQASRR